jgi:hypothetical protein
VRAIGYCFTLRELAAVHVSRRYRLQRDGNMLPRAAAAAGLQALLGPLGRVVQQQLLPEDVAAAAGAEISRTLYLYLESLSICLGQGGCNRH